MATFSGAYGSKPSWLLQLDVWETDLEPWVNQSYVNWALYIYRGNGDTPNNNVGTAFAVAAPSLVSGTFPAYRFGSAGSGTNYSGTPVGGRVLIASGGEWVGRLPDGSRSIQVSAWHQAGATLGTADIAPTWWALQTLRQAPGVPLSPALVWNSDAQVTASWTNQWPDNGAPTHNEVQQRINGGAWQHVSTISAANALSFGTAVNRKVEFRVRATNATGASDWSTVSAPVFTTPAAPTAMQAVKDANQDIVVSWAPQVGYVEHQHVLEHSTDGGSSWSALATLGSGVASYKHVGPNPSVTHRYRVRARATGTGNRTSAWVLSSVVQLLAPPNAPTLAVLPTYVDAAADLVLPWVHNPVDTTPQSAYEVQYSTDGGSSWSSTGKVSSALSQDVVPGAGFAPGVTLTYRVRTWGQASSGGSEGTGASPWSAARAVDFRSRPVVTILDPLPSAVVEESSLLVVLGFAQAEGGTFVQAFLNLWHDGEIIESVESTTLAGTLFQTRVLDGESYAVSVTVIGSHGIWSDSAQVAFTVEYTLPVAAGVGLTYLPESGWAQVDLSLPEPGAGESAAVSVSVLRSIDGGPAEVLFDRLLVDGPELSLLDTTPTIRGANAYVVRTFSADGATADVVDELVTEEGRWSFLSTGPGFADLVRFAGGPSRDVAPGREQALVVAAGRSRPIALFGEAGSLVVSGSAQLVAGLGSSAAEVQAFLLEAGLVCLRDPDGRRVFGTVTGRLRGVHRQAVQFQFSVTEAT